MTAARWRRRAPTFQQWQAIGEFAQQLLLSKVASDELADAVVVPLRHR
jgi:hypothetical protein